MRGIHYSVQRARLGGTRRETRDELAALVARRGVLALVRVLRRYHVGLHADSLLQPPHTRGCSDRARGGRHRRVLAPSPCAGWRGAHPAATQPHFSRHAAARPQAEHQHEWPAAPWQRSSRSVATARASQGGVEAAARLATHRAGRTKRLSPQQTAQQRRASSGGRCGRAEAALAGCQEAGVSAHSRPSRAS